MSLAKPKKKKIGPWQISLGSAIGQQWNEKNLDVLPFHWEFGVGYVVAWEAYLQDTVNTAANDVAIPAYQIDRLMDWQIVGPDGKPVFDRKGWHDPVRNYQSFGQMQGQLAPDITATGGSPKNTSFTHSKKASHAMWRMANPLWRCYPSAWYRGGKFRFFPYTNVNQIAANKNPKLTDSIITLYAWILDVPSDQAFIPTKTIEAYSAALIDPRPTVGPRHLAELLYLMDPANATFGDVLDTYTQIQFGASSDAGYIIAQNTDVVEYMRNWNDEFVVNQPKGGTMGTLTGAQEYYRFLDPTANVSGHLHALPLITPHRGDDLIHMPQWTVKPELIPNNDNISGLPQPAAIWTEIQSRSDDDVKAICDAIDTRAYSRFMGQRHHAQLAGYGGYPDPTKAPLRVPNLFG